MKFCFPKWIGARHAGLGNELLPWAKAFIASAELNLRLLHPAWGLNDRRYYEYFGTSRLDWVGYAALRMLLPCYTFSEADYLATGERDYDRAIAIYSDKMGLKDKSRYVLLTEGLWGGWYAVRKARPFVLRELYKARNVVENLYELHRRTAGWRLKIAVHIRMSDFKAPVNPEDYKGLWNTRMPLEWYFNICADLRDALEENVRFVLFTDGTEVELRDFVSEFRPVTNFDQRYTVCSDLLFMAGADALVCSISSYSMWAAFLSGAPYFWYLPNLRVSDSHFTIWGDPIVVEEGSEVLPRGIPVKQDGHVPRSAIEYLRSKRLLNDVSRDLVQSGAVPAAFVLRG